MKEGDARLWVRGFSGSENLAAVIGNPPNTRVFPAPAQDERKWLPRERARLARVLMGWFVTSLPAEVTIMSYEGEEQHRGRRTHVIAFGASTSGLRRMWLDAESSVPVALLYERDREAVDPPDRDASSPFFVREENVYHGRRLVSGVLVPSRVDAFVAGILAESWPIGAVEVNAQLDPALFKSQGR